MHTTDTRIIHIGTKSKEPEPGCLRMWDGELGERWDSTPWAFACCSNPQATSPVTTPALHRCETNAELSQVALAFHPSWTSMSIFWIGHCFHLVVTICHGRPPWQQLKWCRLELPNPSPTKKNALHPGTSQNEAHFLASWNPDQDWCVGASWTSMQNKVLKRLDTAKDHDRTYP